MAGGMTIKRTSWPGNKVFSSPTTFLHQRTPFPRKKSAQKRDVGGKKLNFFCISLEITQCLWRGQGEKPISSAIPSYISSLGGSWQPRLLSRKGRASPDNQNSFRVRRRGRPSYHLLLFLGVKQRPTFSFQQERGNFLPFFVKGWLKIWKENSKTQCYFC